MRWRVAIGTSIAMAAVFPGAASATPPTGFTLVSPSGVQINSRTPVLTWKRADGAAEYAVQIDGQAAGVVADADCTSTCTFTPAALTEAAHMWTVVARNGDGETGTDTRPFTVDVTLNILSFIVSEPTGVHGVGPAVSVIHGRHCPQAGVTTDDKFATPQYTLDGQPAFLSYGIRLFDCRLAAGPHTVVATVQDQAGNTATASLVFRTDLVRPAVRIDGPTHLVKGQTATFRAVADPGTTVAPAAFTWTTPPEPDDAPCPARSDGAELQLPVTFDSTDLTLSICDAEGDRGSASVHLVAGPKPPRGAPGIEAVRATRHRRRATLRVVWPAGATQVTLTEGRRTRTVPVSRSIPWTFAGTGRRAVRARFDWPLPARTYTARVVVRKRGSLKHRT